MKKFKIACIFGTRPEVIKMAPVIHALSEHSLPADVLTICSGQHKELLIPLIKLFDLTVDANLDVMQADQNLNSMGSRVLHGLGELFSREKFDCIVGQGDTTTVLMSALAAFHLKIPFAHVEAGLRTYDINSPFPEEMNRALVGRIAAIHFAPTQTAADNLIREGLDKNSVYITGNTVIDALYYTAKKFGNDTTPASNKKLLLVTAHRRENHGEPLGRICRALQKIALNHPEVEIIFPVHPNPNVKKIVWSILENIDNVRLMDPLPYEQLVKVLAASYLVITDSGGLQEEAPALKKPVLVLRDETERPELIHLGGGMLVGSNDQLLYETTEHLLASKKAYDQMILGYSPYGTGHSAMHIADHILNFLTTKSTSIHDFHLQPV